MRTRHKKVLVLNATYEPLALIDWKRAITLVMVNQENPKLGLEVVDYYDDAILTCGNKHVPTPAVVRCPKYIKQGHRKIAFSRKHVFLRDQMRCQYCGKQDFSGKDLTYDHVIPRAKWHKLGNKGSPTNWENIVCCCISCNRRKGEKTLKECGFKLKREPKRPTPHEYILGLSPWEKTIPLQWRTYLTPLYQHLLEEK